MSALYPYKPPADAKEWTCPVCGCDVLWCGCPITADTPDPFTPEQLAALQADFNQFTAKRTRLRELAWFAARANHDEAFEWPKAAHGHVGEMDTCPHHDCILVRAYKVT